MGVALAWGGGAMAQEAPAPGANPAAITLPQISVQDSAWQPAQGHVAPATNTATRTVSRLDAVRGEGDIDFVLHEDTAGLGGRTVPPAAWYVLAGDHAAVPAPANILAALPRDAFIEVPGAGERRVLDAPPGFRVTRLLEQAVTALSIAPGEDVFAWVGAESAAARAIRAHLRDGIGIGLDRRRPLVIGSGKLGMSEAEYGKRLDHDRDADHHAVDREDASAHPGNDGRT